MRLTIEQRVAALERETVVLRDTIKMLHKLLKEHRQLIKDYIMQQVGTAGNADQNSGLRPEDALYTFICKQRFDRISKEVESMRKLIDSSAYGCKAG